MHFFIVISQELEQLLPLSYLHQAFIVQLLAIAIKLLLLEEGRLKLSWWYTYMRQTLLGHHQCWNLDLHRVSLLPRSVQSSWNKPIILYVLLSNLLEIIQSDLLLKQLSLAVPMRNFWIDQGRLACLSKIFR